MFGGSILNILRFVYYNVFVTGQNGEAVAIPPQSQIAEQEVMVHNQYICVIHCAPGSLIEALGTRPKEVYESRDLLALYDNESQIKNLAPNLEKLKAMEGSFAVIVTATGDFVDFVSRFFAPKAGIPEDPVTGSAHCTLIPFWAERLGKSTLHARQLSSRGGELFCEDMGERVRISGNAVLYSQGEIYL